MTLRGNPRDLRALAKSLRQSPRVLAQNVAAKAAPVISSLAQAAYDSGSTVYDEPRPLGVAGQQLDLVVSGKVRGALGFSAVGTIVRCVLGPRYSRFLVGKYRILPLGALPVRWSRAIGEIARAEADRFFARKAA